MIFIVEIAETLQRQVEIVAENEDEAICAAKAMYRDGEIVLNSTDHTETSFSVC